MMRSLLSLRDTANRYRSSQDENGITIVEIMVAIVIIAAILIFTASNLTMSSRSSIFSENKTKAQAFANDALAIAKQSPYRQLWIQDQRFDDNGGDGKCVKLTDSKTPNGTVAQVVNEGEGTVPFSGLVECQTRQATSKQNPVGAVFYVQTEVYGVTTANSTYKEVWVTVRWTDISAPTDGWHTVRSSVVVAPTVEDCFITTAGYPSGTTLTSLNATIPGCSF